MRAAFSRLHVLLFLCAGTASAQQVVRNIRVDVALDVDTQGRVVQATPPDDLMPALRGPLQQAVSHWRFKPMMKNGSAVTARTYGRVNLQMIEESPGKYGLRVVYLSNGPSLMFMRAPKFPAEMIRARTEGTLHMEAVVQPDGSLSDIRMTDATISASSSNSKRAESVFERAARNAMASMQAKPEWVDGKPAATRISLPFAFGLNGPSGGGEASGSAIGSATGTAN